MRMKKILIFLLGTIIFSLSLGVFAHEEQPKVENLGVNVNFEGLLKSDGVISKDLINYSMNFINEQIIRYPKVKQFFNDRNLRSFDDVVSNFKEILGSIKTSKEEFVGEKDAVLKDWENFIKKQEFQNQYIEHISGEIEVKKSMNVGAQEIEKLEKSLKDFNGEEFKKFSDTKKQDISNKILESKNEIIVLKEMLENEDLLKKGKERFEKAFEQSGCTKENFSKNLQEIINS